MQTQRNSFGFKRMLGARDIAFCSNLQTCKKRVVDCIVCTVRTDADVAGRMPCGRVAFEELAGDLACLPVNGATTHGLVNGCHV